MVVEDFPLTGKIVVVTGGGSGIGLAFVKLAIAATAKVLIADLRLTDDATKFVENIHADQLVFVKTDVTKREELENLISVSEKVFQDVPDVYIAAAGVFEPQWSSFWPDTEEDNYATISINLIHPMKLTRIAVRALLGKNKPGVVLLVSSLAGLYANYTAALYFASKSGLVNFAHGMAQADEDENVKVVAICPGVVKSPLWSNRPDLMRQYAYSEETAITPETVATAMHDVVESKAYPGGSILQVTQEGMSIVPLSPPYTMGTLEIGPVREILKAERGANLGKALKQNGTL